MTQSGHNRWRLCARHKGILMSQICEAKILKLCVALIGAALLYGCELPPPPAKPSDTLQYKKISDIERPPPYSDALALYFNNRCDEGWNVLWPLAKQGDNDARFIIAESLAMGCEMPIHVSRYDDRQRLSLMLEAYAISEPVRYPLYEQDAQTFRERLGLTLLADGYGTETVRACYASLVDSKDLSVTSSKKCLNKAISLGVMKSFDRFAGNIDQSAKN
jgi:hypothetical protein